MMQKEFEALAGYKVSTEDYDSLIEPMYMALPHIGKKEFVGMLDRKRFEVKEPKKVTFAFVSDGKRTPNGCYFMGNWVAVIDMKVNVKTGKVTYTVRDTTLDEQREIRFDCYLAYHVDIDLNDEKVILKYAA